MRRFGARRRRWGEGGIVRAGMLWDCRFGELKEEGWIGSFEGFFGDFGDSMAGSGMGIVS